MSQGSSSDQGMLVHFTSEAGLRGILQARELGSQWGIFAFTMAGARRNCCCRWLGTLSVVPLPRRIYLTGPAVSEFRPPPFHFYGVITTFWRWLGIRMTPLGSLKLELIDYRNIVNPVFEAKFSPGTIMVFDAAGKATFPPADAAEKDRYRQHQWILDHVFDIGFLLVFAFIILFCLSESEHRKLMLWSVASAFCVGAVPALLWFRYRRRILERPSRSSQVDRSD